MITVNLKTLYPWQEQDELVEITEEMLEAMKTADRQEWAYARRTHRHKANYSLDYGDGIERECIHLPPMPEEVLELKERNEQIYASLKTLTPVQQRRVADRYLNEKTNRQIGEAEKVDPSTIGRSIKSALIKLREFEY